MARVCGDGHFGCHATGDSVDHYGFCSNTCKDKNQYRCYACGEKTLTLAGRCPLCDDDDKIEDFAINAVLDCNTCCGSPPENGNVCICGGSGLARDELLNMRLELFKARERIAELEEFIRVLQKENDNYSMNEANRGE